MIGKAEALDLKEFKDHRDHGFLVVDTRNQADFARGFIPGSINVEFGERFDETLEQFALKDRGIILITDPGQEEAVINSVEELNFSNIGGFISGGFAEWQDADGDIDLVISILADEFALDVVHDKDISAFDLRPKRDFDVLHVEKTENKTVEEVMAMQDELVDTKTYYIFCRDGVKSMALISYLKKHGKHNLYHVEGGFEEIRGQSKIPLVETKRKKKQDKKKDEN